VQSHLSLTSIAHGLEMIIKNPFPLRQVTSIAIMASLLATMLLSFPRSATAAEITPFNTFNQSPIVQIYGLPGPGRAKLLADGEIETGIFLDLASNSTQHRNSREAIVLDGETLRCTLAFSRGFSDDFEAGLELPIVSQSGGFMDGFIEAWHDFFHLPQGARPEQHRNQLQYRYEKEGTTRLDFSDRNTGIGDLRLTGATQLYREYDSAVALRALLKFPTGESNRLTGSGSTDVALWLTADQDYLFEEWGNAAVFGAIGALAKTEGGVLRGQQRTFVGFGTLGAGWSPLEHLAFKLQFSTNTPFYHGSNLAELNAISGSLVIGGTISFTDYTALDIGVAEDVIVRTAPDASFHLALTTRF
jgi:hypothetical protein